MMAQPTYIHMRSFKSQQRCDTVSLIPAFRGSASPPLSGISPKNEDLALGENRGSNVMTNGARLLFKRVCCLCIHTRVFWKVNRKRKVYWWFFLGVLLLRLKPAVKQPITAMELTAVLTVMTHIRFCQ